MFDPITKSYLKWTFSHLPYSLWRLMRLLNVDFDSERRDLLRNLACSIPPPLSDAYAGELKWLRSHTTPSLLTFPYERTGEPTPVTSGFDKDVGLAYVLHNGKKLFLDTRDVSSAARNYQHIIDDEGLTGCGKRTKSPHCYTKKGFEIENGDVILDVGCAEALVALDNIDKVQKAYLFECDKRWIKALQATFAPYTDKTILVQKLVGDGTRGSITLSSAILEGKDTPFFIKMDIEGFERFVIQSSLDFLRNHKVKLSCCVYHRQDDDVVIEKMLKDIGYRTEFSDGFMLPDVNGIKFPYFRHGVLYARNF